MWFGVVFTFESTLESVINLFKFLCNFTRIFVALKSLLRSSVNNKNGTRKIQYKHASTVRYNKPKYTNSTYFVFNTDLCYSSEILKQIFWPKLFTIEYFCSCRNNDEEIVNRLKRKTELNSAGNQIWQLYVWPQVFPACWPLVRSRRRHKRPSKNGKHSFFVKIDFFCFSIWRTIKYIATALFYFITWKKWKTVLERWKA